MTTVSTADSFKVEFVKYEQEVYPHSWKKDAKFGNSLVYKNTKKFKGYIYTGEYDENGKKHGKGVKIYDETKWAIESKFIGTFNNDRIEG